MNSIHAAEASIAENFRLFQPPKFMKKKNRFIAMQQIISEFITITTLMMIQPHLNLIGKLPENYDELQDGQKKEILYNQKEHNQKRKIPKKRKKTDIFFPSH